MDRRLRHQFKINTAQLPVILFDIFAIPMAWCLAFWVRLNLSEFPVNLLSHKKIIAFIVLMTAQIVSYGYFNVYRGLWRFSSVKDVLRILQAVITAVLISIPVNYLVSCLETIPRSVLPLYALILVTILCGARLILRSWWDRHLYNEGLHHEVQRVLIIGAGQAGESLVRDLKRIQTYYPVGFIDDSAEKKGFEVHGVRVLGTCEQLGKIVHKHAIDLVFIAIPSANSTVMRKIVSVCEKANVPCRTLPGLQALMSGEVEVNALRKVNIEDLLGRDQVRIEWDKIGQAIRGRKVLITGGGGSIGSELCRQVAFLEPGTLIILDNNEFNLYNIDCELKEECPTLHYELALVNINDVKAVDQLFKKHKPEIVFHAAAYKHVPMLENQIRVGVLNNVIGTQVVAEASVAFNVEKFVLISTDKAVNPTSIMGTTKRVAEIFCQNLNQRVSTQFITVRFGNVLGSVGSVVPLFQKQLEKGGPLTITHPDVERYFMTIPEATQLILQAMVNGEGGEIFVLDMGEPIKIHYLAEQMIRLAGKEPGKDIQIQVIGLRPGEKLFEELFHTKEALAETSHTKLFKARFRVIDWNELTHTFKLIQKACDDDRMDELLILLKSLVPEFSFITSEKPLCSNTVERLGVEHGIDQAIDDFIPRSE